MSTIDSINGINSDIFTLPATKDTVKSTTFASTLKAVSNPLSCPSDLYSYFLEASEKYGIDVNLLMSIGKEESNFQSDAVSSSGAVGIMQLMPATSKSMGVSNPYNAKENIMGGAKLLSIYLKKYDNHATLALAAYGAGGGAVDKYGGVPPFKETQNAIKKVMAFYAQITNSGTVITKKEALEANADASTDQVVSPTDSKPVSVDSSATYSESASTKDTQSTAILSLLMNYIRQQMIESAALLLSDEDNDTDTSNSLSQSISGANYTYDDYLDFTDTVIKQYQLFGDSNDEVETSTKESMNRQLADANAYYQYATNTSAANPTVLNIMQSLYSQDKR